MRHRRNGHAKAGALFGGIHKRLFGNPRLLGAVGSVAAVSISTALIGSQLLAANDLGEHEEIPTETIVVQSVAPAGEAALISSARTVANSLDPSKLSAFEPQEQVAEAMESYRKLQEVVESLADVEEDCFVFEGVPKELADQYRESELPVWRLMAEAHSVTKVDLPRVAESAEPVFVSRSSAQDLTEVYIAMEELESSISSLPLRAQIEVLDPKTIDLGSVSDSEIAEVLEEEEIPALRLESDRRLADNLPDMSQIDNGHVPAEMLCPIPWNAHYELLCVAVPNLVRLNEAFKAQFGHDLTIESGYRDYYTQELVHAASPTMTTLPGTSNHSWGVAVDFDISGYRSYDHPEVAWLVENAPSYGWRNPKHESFETLLPEPWHFEFGTKYNDDPDWGFLGPVPEVPYQIKFPVGTHTETIYSD